jgi:hypothetical protein
MFIIWWYNGWGKLREDEMIIIWCIGSKVDRYK